MAVQNKKNIRKKEGKVKAGKKKGPPGRVKLVLALRKLLETKEFYSITTDEIARTAKTNEALIYRYFGDKRGLLHKVLAEHLNDMQEQIILDLKGLECPLKKLAIIIRDSFNAYTRHKVFARIILVEARNFPGFFESESYQLVRLYAQLLVVIIKEGVISGDIRDDISPNAIRDSIIGAIEHVMLPSVLFGKELNPDILTEKLFAMILDGIGKKKDPERSRAILMEVLPG